MLVTIHFDAFHCDTNANKAFSMGKSWTGETGDKKTERKRKAKMTTSKRKKEKSYCTQFSIVLKWLPKKIYSIIPLFGVWYWVGFEIGGCINNQQTNTRKQTHKHTQTHKASKMPQNEKRIGNPKNAMRGKVCCERIIEGREKMNIYNWKV